MSKYSILLSKLIRITSVLQKWIIKILNTQCSSRKRTQNDNTSFLALLKIPWSFSSQLRRQQITGRWILISQGTLTICVEMACISWWAQASSSSTHVLRAGSRQRSVTKERNLVKTVLSIGVIWSILGSFRIVLLVVLWTLLSLKMCPRTSFGRYRLSLCVYVRRFTCISISIFITENVEIDLP